MKIIIPTNDRKTIAAHTGRCEEFALFEVENGNITKETFEPNTHHCGNHGKKDPEHECKHDELMKQFSKADIVGYYSMGKNLRSDLEEHQINFQKAKSIHLREIVQELASAESN